MMRAHPRWLGLGLAVLYVILAGCSNTATGTARRPASGTATAAQPTPTATPRPVVANVYYRTYDHTVYALNPADGSVRWTFSRGQGVFDPIVSGNLVYVEAVGQPDALYALDSASGAVAWSANGGVSPTVANGAVYVIVDRTAVECLDAGTGALRWQRQAQGGRLTVAGDTLYVGDATVTSTGAAVHSGLTAIDMADGAIRWTFARDHQGFGNPVVGDGVVYFEAWTEQSPSPTTAQLYALKETDGSQVWNADAPVIANEFALAGSVLYAGGSATGISAYRASDGALLWKNADYLLSRFTAVGNAVYVNTFHGTVLALDATTGTQLWAAAVSGGYAPVVANGLLYVVAGRGSGALVAVNVSTGAIAWQQPVAGTPGPPVVADGAVYTYSVQPDNGPSPVVYAFNAADGSGLWQHPTGLNLETTLAVNDGLSGA